LKICEYDTVSCPYCKEENDVYDAGYVSLQQPVAVPGASLGPWHVVRCRACEGDFAIPCAD
jgi:hypothetical protein